MKVPSLHPCADITFRYIFLVERAYALRAPYMRRMNDSIWLLSMFAILCGFGSIAICGFVWPIAEISSSDGRCRIGLPYRITVPLLCFDVVINTALTAVFIYLLRPSLQFAHSGAPASKLTKALRRALDCASRRTYADVYPVANQHFLKSIEKLLWKSFIGSVLVMLPTVGNLAALSVLRGRELGWLCLTLCTFDGMYLFSWCIFSRHSPFSALCKMHEIAVTG